MFEALSAGDRELGQAAIAAVAIGLLVLAAGVTPAVTGLGVSGDDDTGPEPDEIGTVEDDPDEGVEFDWDWLPDVDIDVSPDLEWLWEVFDSGNGPEGGCTVSLVGDPEPGQDLTVQVSLDGEPLVGATVWYNDREAGETNERGGVTGEVPYDEELEIRVETPDEGECTAETGTAAAGLLAAGGGNSTVVVDVEGELDLDIEEPADPGETVEVTATVSGAAVQDGTVTVDGEEVATTGVDGSASVTVPDDGSSSFDVAVERGDFATERTVEIALLTLDLRGDGILALPGGDGAAVVTKGDEPLEGVPVTVGGETVGTTDEDGVVSLTIPADPTTTLEASAEGQTVTESYISLFWHFGVVLVAVLAGLALLAHRLSGRTGVGVVGGAAVVAGSVLLVEGYLGRGAGAVALLLWVLLGTAVLARRTGGEVPAVDPAALIQRLLLVLEEAADRLVRLVRAVLQSVQAVGDAGRTAGRAVRQRPGLVVGVVLAGLAGYVLGGPWFGLAAVVVAGILWRGATWWIQEPTRAPAHDHHESPERGAEERGAESLRDRWRVVARWVAPRRWQTSTPTEIERQAIAQGYPARPVGELASAFRSVEYGGRSLSETLERRARAAYDAITSWRDGEDGQ